MGTGSGCQGTQIEGRQCWGEANEEVATVTTKIDKNREIVTNDDGTEFGT